MAHQSNRIILGISMGHGDSSASLIIDNHQRAFLNSVFLSSGFGDSASNSLSIDYFLNILVAAESLKNFYDFLCFLDFVYIGI